RLDQVVPDHRSPDHGNGFLLSVSRIHTRDWSWNYLTAIPGPDHFRALWEKFDGGLALDLRRRRSDLSLFQSFRAGRAIVREDSGSACACADANRVSIQTYPARRAHDFRFALHCRVDSFSS